MTPSEMASSRLPSLPPGRPCSTFREWTRAAINFNVGKEDRKNDVSRTSLFAL